MTTQHDTTYSNILAIAAERGARQGAYDKTNGYTNPTPLSGEWAGESPMDIIGDLIDAAERITNDEDYEAYNDVCDAYEDAYLEANAPDEEEA